MSKSQRTKKIPFSEIFQKKENLAVFFTDDILANFQITDKILLWSKKTGTSSSADESSQKPFESVYFLFSDFQVTFFKALLKDYNVSVEGKSFILHQAKPGVIINLNKDNERFMKKWSRHSNKVIIGQGKQVNVKLVPAPEDPHKIIDKASEILNLPPAKPALKLSQTEFNPDKVKKTQSTGKYVIAVNSFWKRKLVLRKLSKTIDTNSSLVIVCPTQATPIIRPKLPLSLKQIISECYGAVRIISDDEKLRNLLKQLGFNVTSHKAFMKL